MEKKVYVSGDAAATARNVVAHSGLIRAAIVADLFQATIWVFLAMTLCLLLKHVNKNAASVMVVFVAIGAGIVFLNEVFEFAGLRAATGAVNLASLSPAGSHALVLLLLDTQHYGFLIAQIFFGLWLAPLGYLAYKSGWFPKVLGIALVVASVSYLVDVVGAFLVPDLDKHIHAFTTIVPSIAEPWMVVYLLVIGVRTARPVKRILAAQLAS